MNELLAVGWTWYPSVLLGFGLWTLLYVWAVNLRPPRGARTGVGQQIAFHLGTFIGLLALVSPIDALGDDFLFSAHMLQHLLLLFVVAPLWLIGMPDWLVARLIPSRARGVASRLLSPVGAWFAFAGVMWVWHVPAVYNLALEYEPLHIIEHLTFIGGGLIGWWPVFGSASASLPRPTEPVRMLYIFFVALACTFIAAIITLSGTLLYPAYAAAPRILGLTPLADQRLGGLMMWLPTHMILLLAMGITFFRWFGARNRRPTSEWLPSSPS
jgi:putative membrane protein